jgi:hypothetical protein
MLIQDALVLIDEIRKQKFKPTDWEANFIQSIEMRKYDLSQKQSLALNKIYEKATGGGNYQRRQYI